MPSAAAEDHAAAERHSSDGVGPGSGSHHDHVRHGDCRRNRRGCPGACSDSAGSPGDFGRASHSGGQSVTGLVGRQAEPAVAEAPAELASVAPEPAAAAAAEVVAEPVAAETSAASVTASAQ
jgi:hypothetical protein